MWSKVGWSGRWGNIQGLFSLQKGVLLKSVFDERNYTFHSGGSRHFKTAVGLFYVAFLSLFKWRVCRDASGRVNPLNPHVCIVFKYKLKRSHTFLPKEHPWTQKTSSQNFRKQIMAPEKQKNSKLFGTGVPKDP